MRRLILVAVLVTALLVAFAGSALADGPHGYNQYGYGMGNYGGYNMGYGGYGGYQKHYPKQSYPKQMYPTYNYCCQYVYNPCPKPYVYQQTYGYGGYGNYGGYAMMNYGSGYGY